MAELEPSTLFIRSEYANDGDLSYGMSELRIHGIEWWTGRREIMICEHDAHRDHDGSIYADE